MNPLRSLLGRTSPRREPAGLRKVAVDLLRPGMFIHDLQVGWMQHTFLRRRFPVKDDRTIEQLRQQGIREVVIDLRRGTDIDDGIRQAEEVRRAREDEALRQRLVELAAHRRGAVRAAVTIDEERWRARLLRDEATQTVKALMHGIRHRRPVDINSTEPVIERMLVSVKRHPDALIPLLQLKDQEAYGFDHSIAAAAMAIALGNTMGLDDDTLRQAAKGALLQDVGKARVPEDILVKPDRLTPYELRLVRHHVEAGQAILEDLPGVSDLMLDIVTHHHERMDGSGYPHALAGDAIPMHAQIAAIVDAYDALISDRPFQARLEPTEALCELFHLAGSQFREDLLHAFVRTMGVYPVGSLVRLDNGHLAVVTEQRRDLLRPVVRGIYNIRDQRYIRPYVLDLSQRLTPPGILGVESFARWGIDPRQWRPA